MPILLEAQAGTPLAQGDLLKGRMLYVAESGPDGQPEEFREKAPDYLLVISRDCKALREADIAILPIFEFKLDLEDATGFETVRRIVTHDRDGDRMPDTFYLGPVEGRKRFAAKVHLPFCIRVPILDERQAWVDKERVARLDPDFIHHLHTRMFGAVARKGFHDYEWFANEDLVLLVHQGQAEIAALEFEAATHRAEIDGALAKGSEKRAEGLSKKLVSAQKKLEPLREKLAPYMAEVERRGLTL